MMEKRNLLQCSKAAVAAACGAFTAVFGWLGWLVLAWGACMALDWVSGSAAAASRAFHQAGRKRWAWRVGLGQASRSSAPGRASRGSQ